MAEVFQLPSDKQDSAGVLRPSDAEVQVRRDYHTGQLVTVAVGAALRAEEEDLCRGLSQVLAMRSKPSGFARYVSNQDIVQEGAAVEETDDVHAAELPDEDEDVQFGMGQPDDGARERGPLRRILPRDLVHLAGEREIQESIGTDATHLDFPVIDRKIREPIPPDNVSAVDRDLTVRPTQTKEPGQEADPLRRTGDDWLAHVDEIIEQL